MYSGTFPLDALKVDLNNFLNFMIDKNILDNN